MEDKIQIVIRDKKRDYEYPVFVFEKTKISQIVENHIKNVRKIYKKETIGYFALDENGDTTIYGTELTVGVCGLRTGDHLHWIEGKKNNISLKINDLIN